MHPIWRSALPPATAAEALLLNGSQQWEAYDGAYLVNTMTQVSNPAEQGDYRDQWFTTADTGVDANGLSGIYLGKKKSDWFPATTMPSRPIPFNTAGAYAVGCAVGTTLTVVVKAYIECFPTPDMKMFVTLTSPSTAYDPMALEMYSRASNKLKPGCKQEMNPAGEYWKMVKGVLKEVAPAMHGAASTAEAIVKPVVHAGKAIKGVRDQTKQFGTDQTNTRSRRQRGRARKGR